MNKEQVNSIISPDVTPFYKRTSLINRSNEWRRWGGFLSATQYDLNHENEYFAIRTKAALLDISPLYKYEIRGADARFFLDRIVTRDIMSCKVGQVIYTPWCDENGKVIDDGTIQCIDEELFRLTSAEPNLSWLVTNNAGLDVEIIDISNSIAALAIQGPNSRKIINNISSENINNLKFFNLCNRKLNNIPTIISRTGYTGDLGYEIWIESKDALDLWDTLISKGKIYGLTPTGLNALDMARIEAGLILLDVDYISSNHALIENSKSSPIELGLGWTINFNKNYFIGKEALKKEFDSQPKWIFRGIEIQWEPLEKHYNNIGLPPTLPTKAWRTSTPIFDNNKQIGYATSGCWSPLLKSYIALAHLRANFAQIGRKLDFEINVEHFKKLTPAIITQTPFFNPGRKRSCPK